MFQIEQHGAGAPLCLMTEKRKHISSISVKLLYLEKKLKLGCYASMKKFLSDSLLSVLSIICHLLICQYCMYFSYLLFGFKTYFFAPVDFCYNVMISQLVFIFKESKVKHKVSMLTSVTLELGAAQVWKQVPDTDNWQLNFHKCHPCTD